MTTVYWGKTQPVSLEKWGRGKMPAVQRARVVSVLNLKGGVGKTTISAHVMRVLYRTCRKRVLLIDLDPQFNLTQTVLTRSEYDRLLKAKKTIFQAMEPPSTVSIFDVATTNEQPPPAADLSEELRHMSKRASFLDLIAGDFNLVKYSLISDHNKLERVKRRFLKFIAQARQDHDLIVIDCNPSSSFITLCALHACTDILVPVRPDKYSVLGVELLADFLERLTDIDPKPAMTILLNDIPRSNYDAAIENELRKHKLYGTLVLANRLHTSKLLGAKSSYTGFATDKPVKNRNLVTAEIDAIVKELRPLWGL